MTLETPPLAAEKMDPAVRALLPNYIRRRESDVETLVQLMAREDYNEVARLGHNMRGSGSAYGFPRITQLGGLIEEAVRTQDIAALTILINELDAFVQQMSPQDMV